MRNWCYSGDSVWTVNKEDRPYRICSRNIETINSISYHYDIKPGDLFATEESLKHIFGFLSDYDISYEDTKLDLQELNNRYPLFDQWVIMRPNGRVINKAERNVIRSTLQQSRYSFIETEWSKQYENMWNDFIHDIEGRVTSIKAGGQKLLNQDDMELIMKYLIMFDWRSRSGNSIFNEILDCVCNIIPGFKTTDIPLGNRVHREDRTIIDELRNALYRKAYYEFLNSAGWMNAYVDSYLANLTFAFYLTDGSDPFITSDNPAFMFTNDNDQKEHVFVALPTLLITTCRADKEGTFIVSNPSAHEVAYYNQVIASNGELSILPNNKMDISQLGLDNHWTRLTFALRAESWCG